MTELLEKAFAKIAKLPAPEQNVIANWLMEELASKQMWQKSFETSESTLLHLAKEALEEYRLDSTEPLDPTTL